ncbi:hypothetical protein [Nonomuraea aridisoli]|uniref:SH3 domain-containing protein n=1 Tax=Nonomuraea aridisoli TaxID=2070368 RepID=A0A2W2FB97_9ACTN|nr:hypothetical protein [Nonomuraea aridisoli]PZG12844.1 hypothetical protein C1J01_31630 [Nonomuraea aridisoli]
MHITRVAVAGLLASAALTGLRYDFAAHGVVIWAEPRAGSVRNGVGHPGHGFEPNRSEEHGLYRCDAHFDSTLWYHGRDATTGVVGWVPACHLTDDD